MLKIKLRARLRQYLKRPEKEISSEPADEDSFRCYYCKRHFKKKDINHYLKHIEGLD